MKLDELINYEWQHINLKSCMLTDNNLVCEEIITY